MTEFTIDFNFRPEVLETANDADAQVGQILDEIKGELVGSPDQGNEVVKLGSEALYRSNN
jgi:hypothetical protein